MRTLVLADIHHRWVQAQSLIDTIECDRVILLGDYFDCFNDNPYIAHSTATWLKELVLTNPKITPLIGNHDQYYFWPYCDYILGSGYSPQKKDAIRSVITKEDIDKFQYFTVDQGYVLSHAGLTSKIWKQFLMAEYDVRPEDTTIEFFTSILAQRIELNKNLMEVFRPPELFMPGWDRGGSCRYGGITWGDWSSFGPVKGINQIVGHTPHYIPEILIQRELGNITRHTADRFYSLPINMSKVTSINFALDTHSEHYAIIEDGVVDIYDISTRMSFKEMIASGVEFNVRGRPAILETFVEAEREALRENERKKWVTVDPKDLT